MNSSDILYHICSRCNDETLFSLSFHAGLRDDIAKLLSLDDFWRNRAELTLQRLSKLPYFSDYRSVYYSLLAASRETDPERIATHALTNIELLLVLEQEYDLPREVELEGSTEISLPVLKLLLTNYTITSGVFRAIALTLLYEITSISLPDLQDLLSMLTDNTSQYVYKMSWSKQMILNVLTLSASRGDLEIFDAVWTYIQNIPTMDFLPVDSLRAVAMSHNSSMFELALKYTRSTEHLKALVDSLASREDVETLYFLQGTSIHKMVNWSNILDYGIKYGKVRLVKHILSSPDLIARKNTLRLVLAAITTLSLDMFKLVLADPRVDIMTNLRDILSYINNPWQTKKTRGAIIERPLGAAQASLLDHLLADERVIVDELPIDNLELIYTLYEVGKETLNWTGLLGRTVRYIVVKRPSSSQLVDWMISTNRVEFALAAELVHNNQATSDLEVEPYRALLFSLLHPKVSLSDILQEVHRDSVMLQAYLLV